MMQLFETLNEDNFLLYAAKHYYKPRCIDAEEFYEDLNRFKYLKKLFNRYENQGTPSERLVLNHLIVIFNVFGVESGLRMLEFKIDRSQWPILKPYLILLKCIEADGLKYAGIPMDPNIVEVLRKI